jgi:hypothetical protein
MYPGYKNVESTPHEKIDKQDLLRRMDVLRAALSWILPQHKSTGCEADDVIAAFCYLEKGPIVIYSGDTDFWQLVNNRVSIYRARQGAAHDYITPVEVCQKFNVSHPLNLRWLRALTGCKSDTIKGSTIPEKFLSKMCTDVYIPTSSTHQLAWLEEFEVICKRAKEILTPGWLKKFEAFKLRAIRNYRIMTLSPPRTDSFLTCEYEPNFNKFFSYCQNLQMASLYSYIEQEFGSPPPINEFDQAQFQCPWKSMDIISKKEDELLGEMTNWKVEVKDADVSPA